MLAAARNSIGSLLLQILSIASAVGLGIYGEGLWQARQDKIETNRLISAIATEMGENRHKIVHFMYTLDYWSSEEPMTAPLAYVEELTQKATKPAPITMIFTGSGGEPPKAFQEEKQPLPKDFPIENVLPDVAPLLPPMLDYVPERVVWTSAQYQREFADIDVGCLSHIQAINRSHDELVTAATGTLLPLFQKYADAHNKSSDEREEIRRAIRAEMRRLHNVFNSPAQNYLQEFNRLFIFNSTENCDLTPNTSGLSKFIGGNYPAQVQEDGTRTTQRSFKGEDGKRRAVLFSLYPRRDLLEDESGNFNPSTEANLRNAEIYKQAKELSLENLGKPVMLEADGKITVGE